MAKLSLAEHETVITYIEIDAHIWPKVIAVTALLKSKVYSLSLLGVDLGVNLKIELVKPLLLEAFRGLFDSRRLHHTQGLGKSPGPFSWAKSPRHAEFRPPVLRVACCRNA